MLKSPVRTLVRLSRACCILSSSDAVPRAREAKPLSVVSSARSRRSSAVEPIVRAAESSSPESPDFTAAFHCRVTALSLPVAEMQSPASDTLKLLLGLVERELVRDELDEVDVLDGRVEVDDGRSLVVVEVDELVLLDVDVLLVVLLDVDVLVLLVVLLVEVVVVGVEVDVGAADVEVGSEVLVVASGSSEQPARTSGMERAAAIMTVPREVTFMVPSRIC